MMSLSTPVAFLIFNRPELTKIVFAAIRQAKPYKLLVVADGARFPEEAEKCQETRDIINQVDWNCEVLTNFSKTNLGCKKRISSGLSWVFSEVEEAIILEDDCLPSPSFFQFCQTLLEYYRHDSRIMHISGSNFQDSQNRNDFSYYLSKYAHIWGWASWRRAWKHYDITMKTWPHYKKSNMLGSICESAYEQKYWTDKFDNVFNNSIDTWDYQWLYTCWHQNGLSILPRSNLVSNIGFGADATHTKDKKTLTQSPNLDIWDIKHPLFIVRDINADNYTFDRYYKNNQMKNYHKWLAKLKNVTYSISSKFTRSIR